MSTELIEKEIESIDNIKEWSLKVKKMKEIKDKITEEKNKINSFIDMINNNTYKSKNKKKSSLDDLIKEFSNTDDIEVKVKTFCLIQSKIKETESELFDN
jgi:uncharacterized protein YpuA (DUF1002 family)